MNQQCQGTTKAGKRCRSTITDENGLCPAHRPGGADAMRLRAQRGGEATKRRFSGKGLPPKLLGSLETIADAQRWLRLIAQAVGARELTHSEGAAMTAAVREWVRAETERLKVEDLEELRGQVAELKKLRAV